MLYQPPFFVLVSRVKGCVGDINSVKKIINSLAKAKMVSQNDASNSIDVDN